MKKISFVVLFIVWMSTVMAQTIMESGYLRDKTGQPIVGNVTMAYKLFSQSIGGTSIWESGDLTVTLTEGIYSVQLGSAINPIDETKISSPTLTYYIEQTINTETLFPRKQLAFSARSILANKALTANFATLAGQVDWNNVTNKQEVVTIGMTASQALSATSANFATNASLLGMKAEAALNVLSALTAVTADSILWSGLQNVPDLVTPGMIIGRASSANYAIDASLLNNKVESMLNVATAQTAITANYSVLSTTASFINWSGVLSPPAFVTAGQITLVDRAITANYATNSGLLNNKAELALNVATALTAITANVALLANGVEWSGVIGKPTNVSAFTNDSGYLTANSTLSNALFALTANYAANSGLLNNKAELALNVATSLLATTSNYAANAGAATTAGLATTANVALLATGVEWSGVIGKPTNVSAFTNDSGYLTANSIITNALFASTANYSANSDLLNNKAEAALNVATSLLATTANYATNAATATTANVALLANGVEWSGVTGKPTNVSSFTNDSGYLTANSTITSALSALTANYAMNSGLLNNKAEAALNVATALTATTANVALLATGVEWSGVTGKPTNVSAFTNDSGYLTANSTITSALSALTANYAMNSDLLNNKAEAALNVATALTATTANYATTAGAATTATTAGFATNAGIATSAGSATTANVALTANAVLWSGVNGRPTNVSAFNNDSGYITANSTVTSALSASTANYAMNSGLLNNKAEAALNVATALTATTANYATTAGAATTATTAGFATNAGIATSAGLATTANVALTANAVLWSGVNGRPTNVSAFNNDSGYITANSTVTSALSASTANYAMNSGLLNNKAEAALNVATALTATTANYAITAGAATTATTAGFATNAGIATSAGSATTANVALTANAVLWSGVNGRPTNVSAFNNDSGYITANSTVTSALSASTANYAMNSGLLNNKAEAALNVATALTSTTANYATSAGSATTANVALTANAVLWSGVNGKPTNVSSFNNDSGYITANSTVTSALSASTANYAMNSGLLNNKAEAALNVASALTSTTANYATTAGAATTATTAGFATNAGLATTANVALTANAVLWSSVIGKPTNVSSFINDGVYLTLNSTIPIALTASTANYAINSGTAGIATTANVALTANAVLWSGINGRPTNVSSFINDGVYLTANGTINNAVNALTANVALIAVNANNALTANFSSTAQTANYINWLNVGARPDVVSTGMTIGLALTANYAALASLATTANYALTANYASTVADGSIANIKISGMDSSKLSGRMSVSSGTSVFYIDSNGRVGIGRSNPSSDLHVNGTIEAGFFKGDASLLTNIPSTGGSGGISNTENTTIAAGIATADTDAAVVNIMAGQTARLQVGSASTKVLNNLIVGSGTPVGKVSIYSGDIAMQGIAVPSQPADSWGKLYVDSSDGQLYYKNDANVVTLLSTTEATNALQISDGIVSDAKIAAAGLSGSKINSAVGTANYAVTANFAESAGRVNGLTLPELHVGTSDIALTANYAITAGSAVVATTANGILWTNVVGKPTALSSFGTSDLMVTTNYFGSVSINGVLFATSLIGNGSGLTSLAGASVTGVVNNAITANYAENANNFSGKTADQLTVGTANIALTANVALLANAVADGIITDVKVATGINGAKLTGGNVPTANYALTANYASSAATVASAGALGLNVGTANIALTANTVINNSITNAKVATGIDGAKITGGNVPTANYAVTANYATTAGTVTSGGALNLQVGTANVALIANAVVDGIITDAKVATGINGAKITAGNVPTANVALTANYAEIAGSALTLGGTGAGSLSVSTANTALTANVALIANAVADGIITNEKVAAGIDGAKITGGNVPTANIALTANAVLWTAIVEKPTSVSGYGITDLIVTNNFFGGVSVNGSVSASTFIGNGAGLSAINAANIDSGTLGNQYLPSNISINGIVTASAFVGVGSSLTSLTGANVIGVVNNAITADVALTANVAIMANDVIADSITSTKILDATIISADIAASAITTPKLAPLSVDNTKIAVGTIISTNIASSTIASININIPTGWQVALYKFATANVTFDTGTHTSNVTITNADVKTTNFITTAITGGIVPVGSWAITPGAGSLGVQSSITENAGTVTIRYLIINGW